MLLGMACILLHFRNRISLRWQIVTAVAALGMLTLAILAVPTLRGRVSELIAGGFEFEAGNPTKQTGLTIRLVKWNCAWEIIQENPITGVTVGDSKFLLSECYKRKKFWGYNSNFNAHNQYLHYMLISGLGGLLVYLLVLGVPLRLALKHRDAMLLVLIVIIAVVSVTEVIMARQKAIMFVSLFYSLALLPYLKPIKRRRLF